jgi:hypothetical protein
MAQQDEPNEEDAQRRRSFLEEGAPVSLEEERTYEPEQAKLTVPNPLTVELPDTADVTTQLAEDDDREAVLTLEFEHMAQPPDFGLVVFVNTPAANSDTPVTDPGYLGSIAFFHPEEEEHEATAVQLPAETLSNDQTQRVLSASPSCQYHSHRPRSLPRDRPDGDHRRW